MNQRPGKRGFAARPGTPDTWVRSPASSTEASLFSARLTIDVPPALRGRIKIAAFRRGQTVADMLRDLLTREFPDSDGTPS